MKKTSLIFISAVILFSFINASLAQSSTNLIATVIHVDKTSVVGAKVWIYDHSMSDFLGDCSSTNSTGFCEINFDPPLSGYTWYWAIAYYPSYPNQFGIIDFKTDSSGNGKVTVCEDGSSGPCDAIPPEYSNPNGPGSGVYSPTATYNFNITWTDENAVSKVLIQIGNSTNVLINNASLTNSGGNNYTYSINLPSGAWYWKSYANDTANNWASTDQISFTISKATSTVLLTVNPPTSINYETLTTATCTDTNPEATANLYRDESLANSENGVAIRLSATTNSYVCNVSETQNYMSASSTQDYLVNPKNANVKVYPITQSIANGTSVNQYCTDDSTLLNCNIYRNDTQITNNTQYTPAIGVYIYKANITDTFNYTNYQDTSTLTVKDMTPPKITITSPIVSVNYYKVNTLLNSTTDEPTDWSGYKLDSNPQMFTLHSPANLTGLTDGSHTVTVYANDTYGNMGSSSAAFFYCKSDIDGTKSVGILDVVMVTGLYGKKRGDPGFNADRDLNDDGKIDILDVVLVTGRYGKTC